MALNFGNAVVLPLCICGHHQAILAFCLCITLGTRASESKLALVASVHRPA